ncbi:hypothetical protein QNH20_25010 [Neobacillus sp. WH10]|uniref:hypothetical protein n=1 Tax=Neobacillus sp. WH10 TaxID=3047873 RepID=UPI0024C13FA5|nr:hypothetical protein [Neobacillus sp. WH10]WHY77294.1 hypothetical protein QNH20_25010 [Neobacillus sp. WH10]
MNRRLFFISLIFGWLAVSISPILDTVIVSNSNDLSHLRLGFPLPIIEQNTSLTPMEGDFPITLGLLNPKENATDLLVFNYSFSILIITVISYICILLMKLLVRRLIKV